MATAVLVWGRACRKICEDRDEETVSAGPSRRMWQQVRATDLVARDLGVGSGLVGDVVVGVHREKGCEEKSGPDESARATRTVALPRRLIVLDLPWWSIPLTHDCELG